MAHRIPIAKHLTSPSFGNPDNSILISPNFRKSNTFPGGYSETAEIKFCTEAISSIQSDGISEGQNTPNFKSIINFDPFDKYFPRENITLSTEDCENNDELERSALVLEELLNFQIDDIPSIYDNSDSKLLNQDKNFVACGCKLF
ncbi:hypothetical protein SteCoe_8719 [Stentor coeruleus]|uniref:Uncharacterized protein n=1 Tax=Stentor coeruleus TaxID=5963 RepID=A0A1R2CJK2_9CILI|nr:hypothetical protein SteCoe_8719 [Stentor coeruleus]